MAYEKKPNEGTLFANKDKQTDSHPNAKGDALIGGVEYWVSAWTNVAKGSGDRFQKLKFTAKDQQQQKAEPQGESEPFNDEIPF